MPEEQKEIIKLKLTPKEQERVLLELYQLEKLEEIAKELRKNIELLKKIDIYQRRFDKLIDFAAELKPYRDIQRAKRGSRITIPFYDEDGVQAGGEKYLFSSLISNPFIVKTISANYPIGAEILKLFVFVSEEKEENQEGHNLLAKYSPSPYLILAGGGGKIEATLDPIEFPPNFYIKLYFKNESPESRTIDAKVDVVIFPLFKETK